MIRHVVRIDQGGTVKKIIKSKPEERRKGRPRLRWMEDVEKELREVATEGSRLGRKGFSK